MLPIKTTFLKDYKPSPFLIKTVELIFSLDETLTQVHSQLTLSSHTAKEQAVPPLVLQGENIELISIKLDGHYLTVEEYEENEKELIILCAPRGDFSLEIKTQIRPKENRALSGLYVSRGIFCTQCEAQGFRRITYFIDRPDVLARYTTTLIAERIKYPILLSNGNRIDARILENNRHAVTWKDPFKKPSYLFALVAGDLEYIQDEFVTRSHRKVTLQIFSEKGRKERCHHAMASLKKAMRWDENAYGREYDLDIFMVAVIDDFNMGAMENKGLNIFNAQTILANPQTATDADYAYVTKVVGHEYFHNWTGNRITCRDWFQLSLKEGLTVFREQEFSESLGNAVIERINTVRQLRAIQFAEDASPLAHPVQPDSYVEINNFYTTTIYEKGAELIRMMKVLIGETSFRKGTDIYFDRYDGQAVTIEDFITSIEAGSHYDLQQFRLWYKQSGTPELQIDYSYTPETEIFDLRIQQSCLSTPGQRNKKPFHIPFAMALLNQEGKPLSLKLFGEPEADLVQQRILEVKVPEQHFQFINIKAKPVPSLLRNFSAPVKLKVNYSDEELAFLMQKDTDGFNRWDASQQLTGRIVLRRIQASIVLPDPTVTLLMTTYRDLLRNSRQENEALLAELLNLPSEAYFSEQMNPVDVDGIHRERKRLCLELAEALKADLLLAYQAHFSLNPYRFDITSVARRRLANTCLSYLMLLLDPHIHHLCVAQYQKADNMTDKLHALSELVNNASPDRQCFLTDFYEKWSADPLVICKWFAIQARAPLSDALICVKKLLHHPAFEWKNPNKIRALIGVFCSENRVQFHDRSGKAYLFLREQIQYLDRFNPQMAARLVKPFTQWRRFDRGRQLLMREQLEQLIKTPHLSVDVHEIASKSLVQEGEDLAL